MARSSKSLLLLFVSCNVFGYYMYRRWLRRLALADLLINLARQEDEDKVRKVEEGQAIPEGLIEKIGVDRAKMTFLYLICGYDFRYRLDRKGNLISFLGISSSNDWYHRNLKNKYPGADLYVDELYVSPNASLQQEKQKLLDHIRVEFQGKRIISFLQQNDAKEAIGEEL